MVQPGSACQVHPVVRQHDALGIILGSTNCRVTHGMPDAPTGVCGVLDSQVKLGPAGKKAVEVLHELLVVSWFSVKMTAQL
jgi:hypothetical protein